MASISSDVYLMSHQQADRHLTDASYAIREGASGTTASSGRAHVSGSADESADKRAWLGVNLFWRTFFMIATLLSLSMSIWFYTMRSVDSAPRAREMSQQIASLVNLSRAALVYSDVITRYALIKTLAEDEGVRILPREPGDKIVPMPNDQTGTYLTQELQKRLGEDAVIAKSVNDTPGLWVGFDIDEDMYWLLADESLFKPVGSGTGVLVWLIMASLLSLAGAAMMAGIVNYPLKKLLSAIGKVHEGDFSSARLDETSTTKEIREVNIGFNRMAEQMAKVEQERALMLAGISHDLRTPLARLRLEIELSVPESEAQSKKNMEADIEQLDTIISKFMDYAKPHVTAHASVQLSDAVQTCAYPYMNAEDISMRIDVDERLRVQADEIELARVISNLIENARRYGKTPDTNITQLHITAEAEKDTVYLRIRDHGAGVPESMLAQLTQPFFRADEARTSAVGSGLGLAIVKKVVEHMGGRLAFENHAQGGLMVHITLLRAE